MKTFKSSASPQHAGLPAYSPKRVRRLLYHCTLELQKFQGRHLPLAELGRYCGQAASTVSDKLQSSHHPQIESLLCWLERLPEPVRARLLQEACRCFPTLAHPRLSHDPAQVTLLKSLLQPRHGLTLISGGNEGLRTFVLTALGHASRMLGPESRSVSGLDRSQPDWFVPVDGVTYLNAPLPKRLPGDLVRQAWSALESTARGTMLLNGILSLAPSLYRKCFVLSGHCNVFLAEADECLPVGDTKRSSLTRLKVWLTERDRIQVALLRP